MKRNNDNWLRSHPLVMHLCVMLGVSIVALVIILQLLKVFARHGKEFEMPDLVGVRLDEAVEGDRLDLDFVVLDSVYNSEQNGGEIIMQEPKAGSMIKKGRKVYVTVAAYSEGDSKMPDILSQPLRPALSRLENAGLIGGKVHFVMNPNATKGLEAEVLGAMVNGRRIFAGEDVKRGTVVDLEVGLSEREMSKQAMVPFLLGKDQKQARKQLLSASMNVGAEHYDRDVKNKAKAVVYRQEPEYTGFANYQLGSSVELWYKEMDAMEIDQMVKNFQVDSSKIPSNDELHAAMDEAVRGEWEF